MSPSIFIHAEHVHLNAPLPLVAELKSTEGFTAGDIATAAAEGFTRGQTSKPAFAEIRELGDGEPITQKQALKELAKLGEGWRLETPHELFGLVDYGHKNQHGAYTRDETLKANVYWTAQETPWSAGGRVVVVGFYDGDVYVSLGYLRALARAVRVSGQ